MVASRVLRTIPILIAVCLASLPVYAQYSGSTGERVQSDGETAGQ